MTDQDHIDRINAITSNARSTWFALLAALVFVGITLMGVEHIDFYGVNRATKLPLVDVEVPTRSFFIAAPVLTAAIFGYFHLYLIRLWDALSKAPYEVKGQPLGDAITPWLVSDAALHLRAKLRQEFCATPRTMEGAATVLNLALAWGFGFGIIAWLWWASMPARSIWITSLGGGALLATLYTGISSLALLPLRMAKRTELAPPSYAPGMPAILILAFAIPLVSAASFQRTMGLDNRLAPLNLSSEDLVEKPIGWLPYEIAFKEFRALWCKREFISDCRQKTLAEERAFRTEWAARRMSSISELVKPNWHQVGRLDLRNANLTHTFLSGAEFGEALLEDSELMTAQLDNADLRWANLEGANLTRAQLTGSYLQNAQLQLANLSFAYLNGSAHDKQYYYNNIHGTDLTGADVGGAAFRTVSLRVAIFDEFTDFRNVFLDGSVLLPRNFEEEMEGLCQRVDGVLNDDEFFGRWRGWVERGFWNWAAASPPGWEDVLAIPPPADCYWKTGPMPPPTQP